jgi:hypothetical protein
VSVDKGKRRAVDGDHDEGAQKRQRLSPSHYLTRPDEGMRNRKIIQSRSRNRNPEPKQSQLDLTRDWELDNSGEEGTLPDGLGKLAVSSSSSGRGQSVPDAGTSVKKSLKTKIPPIRRPNLKRK